jgi:uncharacterized protein (TIGR00251 family)
VAAPPTAWRAIPEGCELRLRVTPNAGADRIDGVEIRDDGNAVLRIRVRAVPDKGKANAAVISLLAKSLGVPRTSIAVVSGETARLKTVRIGGDGARLAQQLATLGA